MIYYQYARVAINKPEKGNFSWYWMEEGVRTDDERYNEKKYIWSDEKLEGFQYEMNKDCFFKKVRNNKCKYFEIKKKLFSGREYLVCENGGYDVWYLDEIERVDIRFYYEEQSMTIGEAEDILDVEEYAKMMKGLGLNDGK